MREPSSEPCCECGQEGYELDWVPEARDRLLARGTCFYCDFWLEVVERRDSHVVISGTAWRPCADEPELRARTGGWGLGCSGQEHRIVLSDGRLLRCVNLWRRGDVPEIFRGRLPDDARFATATERKGFDWASAITHLPTRTAP